MPFGCFHAVGHSTHRYWFWWAGIRRFSVPLPKPLPFSPGTYVSCRPRSHAPCAFFTLTITSAKPTIPRPYTRRKSEAGSYTAPDPGRNPKYNNSKSRLFVDLWPCLRLPLPTPPTSHRPPSPHGYLHLTKPETPLRPFRECAPCDSRSEVGIVPSPGQNPAEFILIAAKATVASRLRSGDNPGGPRETSYREEGASSYAARYSNGVGIDGEALLLESRTGREGNNVEQLMSIQAGTAGKGNFAWRGDKEAYAVGFCTQVRSVFHFLLPMCFFFPPKEFQKGGRNLDDSLWPR